MRWSGNTYLVLAIGTVACLLLVFYKPQLEQTLSNVPRDSLLKNSVGVPPASIDAPFTVDEVIAFRIGKVTAEDTRLIKYAKGFMAWPSPQNKGVNLPEEFKNRIHFSQIGQSHIVDRLLKGRRRGFFVECGACTGIGLSNTLFFERSRGWSGLLIEPNPSFYKGLLLSGRNATTANVCLSPTPYAQLTEFFMSKMFGGIRSGTTDHRKPKRFRDSEAKQCGLEHVQCVPFYTLLLAMGVNHIDYFSLDIEGVEVDVLKTIPFDKVTVDVFTIEWSVNGRKLEEIRAFFRTLPDYEEVRLIQQQDVVFRRKDQSKRA